MGRRERPVDSDAGAAQKFAAELRRLREEAGGPTYREMAQRTPYSMSTLSRAADGRQLPSLSVALAYVAACGGDPAEWERRWHEAVQGQADAAPGRGQGDGAPYRGLARFEPEDREVFFGRQAATEALLQRVRKHRVVTVLGPSGSGKSSLIRAGLIPALREGGAGSPLTAVRVLTPGSHPVATHAPALQPAEGDGETVVIVDQFEEVFTLCADLSERERFLHLIVAAADQASRLRVVLGVRADFYGRLLQHAPLAAVTGEAILPVAPMTPQELREVIVGPATVRKLIVERALTARLIEEVAAEASALPLLSHVLLETWRRRRGRVLTLAAYEAAGGMRGAIAQTAEALYGRLDAEQQAVTRRIMLRLVNPGAATGDTRRPVNRAQFAFQHCPTGPDVLERLVQARLLRLDGDTVTLVHEALIDGWPRLRQWIDEDRERLIVHRRLADAAALWAHLGRDPGALLRGVPLAAAEDAFAAPGRRNELTPAEAAFLSASITAREREVRAAERTTRRLRRFSRAVSLVSIMALIAGGIAWKQYRVSEDRRQVAVSRQLAARSATLLRDDPDLASLLAVRAFQISPTKEAAASLYAAANLPLASRLTVDDGSVYAAAFSPDGRTLAGATSYGQVYVWDAHTGKTSPGWTLPDEDAAQSMAFSPDGRTLATVGRHGRVTLWSTTSHRVQSSFIPPRSPAGDLVKATAISRDTRLVAMSDSVGAVTLWEASTGRLHARLPKRAKEWQALEFSPDGRLLAGADDTGAITTWDVPARRVQATVPGTDDGLVSTIAFRPDGAAFATGGAHGVRLHDATSGAPTKTFDGPAEDLAALAFSPDGRTLAGRGERSVTLWGASSGRVHRHIPLSAGTDGHLLTGLAFSPDGRTVASGAADASVRLLRIRPDTQRTTLHTHGEAAPSVAISPDGHTLAVAESDGDGLDGAVRVWNTPTGAARPVRLEQARRVTSVAISPDGRTLAGAGAGRDTNVWLWDIRSRKLLTALPGERPVSSVRYSPRDEHVLAAVEDDGQVRLWDTRTRKAQPVTIAGDADQIAFSPDGRTLAVNSLVGKDVWLWDTEDAKVRATLHGHTTISGPMAFSSDGRTLATVNAKGDVKLWDIARGKVRALLTTHVDRTRGMVMALSPDGKTLVIAGSRDGAIMVWDVPTGVQRPPLSGHHGTVLSLAFSRDGNTLVSGGTDGTARLWKVDSPRPDTVVRTLCRTIGRDLTRQEQSQYAPDEPLRRTCPG